MHFPMLKRNAWLILLSLSAFAGLARAQSVTFNVPFEFNVGKIAMPAGAYIIEQASEYDLTAFRIRGVNQTSAAQKPNDFFNAEPAERHGVVYHASVVFHCYGKDCFLSQIWSGRDDSGRQLNESRKEEQIAKGGEPPRVLMVAALR